MRQIRRLIAAAAVLGLFTGGIAAPPAASAAPAGQKCAELYSISKPPPGRSSLPGFNGRQETARNPRPNYGYDNPGEAQRALAQPSARDLARVGVDTSKYPAGSQDHAFAAWNRYLQR